MKCSSSLPIEIQRICVPELWIKFSCRAASPDFKLLPSLVVVKEFQQTAGKTTLIIWGEKCVWPSAEKERGREEKEKTLASARNNREDGDNLTALNHQPFQRPGLIVSQGFVFYFIFIIIHTWRLFFFSSDDNGSLKARPATWWIAADYRTDTFIWSVSWVILSSLTLHPNPVPARSTARDFKSGWDSGERNETYFTWTLSHLFAVDSAWNVQEDELLKAAVGASVHMRSFRHTCTRIPTHTHPHTLSLSEYD